MGFSGTVRDAEGYDLMVEDDVGFKGYRRMQGYQFGCRWAMPIRGISRMQSIVRWKGVVRD